MFVTRPLLCTTHVHYKSPLSSEIASHGNEEKMNYEWAVKAIRVGGVESIYMCSVKNTTTTRRSLGMEQLTFH